MQLAAAGGIRLRDEPAGAAAERHDALAAVGQRERRRRLRARPPAASNRAGDAISRSISAHSCRRLLRVHVRGQFETNMNVHASVYRRPHESGRAPVDDPRGAVGGRRGRGRGSCRPPRGLGRNDPPRSRVARAAAAPGPNARRRGADGRALRAARFGTRAPRHHEEKRRIARAAAELVTDGMAVGLTGGTTCTEVAREIVERERLTVVTNALNIASRTGGPTQPQARRHRRYRPSGVLRARRPAGGGVPRRRCTSTSS